MGMPSLRIGCMKPAMVIGDGVTMNFNITPVKILPFLAAYFRLPPNKKRWADKITPQVVLKPKAFNPGNMGALIFAQHYLKDKGFGHRCGCWEIILILLVGLPVGR